MKKSLPFILIALAIAVFAFFIDPQYDQVQLLTQQREENNTMLGLSNQLKAKRDALHKAFDDISAEERQELEKLLPDTVDNVRLILAIDDIARQYGIGIKGIVIGREGQNNDGANPGGNNAVSSIDTSGNIGTINLKFTIEATYKEFLSFIEDLEGALRVVDIKTLEISKVGTDGVFMKYGIGLDTYWLR
jgi:hypothetical protein